MKLHSDLFIYFYQARNMFQNEVTILITVLTRMTLFAVLEKLDISPHSKINVS